jgi:hypothetical protein
MSTEFASKELPPEGRPGFLSALCIIIFIFAGWSLIGNLIEAAAPPDPAEVDVQLEETMDKVEALGTDISEEMLESIRVITLMMVENARPIALLKALAAVLALAGAYMMWKLKKQGFHLYVIGGILWAFAPMIFIGANMITWIYAVMYGFIVLIFSIMFAVNRKYMIN